MKLSELTQKSVIDCEHTRLPECPGERLGACPECVRAALLAFGEAVREKAAGEVPYPHADIELAIRSINLEDI
jgi:hypothetical protein